MNAEEMWLDYCNAAGVDVSTPYEAWAFGGAPDELADLVLRGIKTATASGYELYELDDEPLPQAGDYSVVLNSRNEAVCVIRTLRTSVVPFDEVGEEQAYKEGEGDRSLVYWREVHDAFFADDYASCGAEFTHKSKILCEEFAVCWPINGSSK